jgi:hypothetical protein
MPATQPIASLVKILELDSKRPRGRPERTGAAKDLRELLSKPVAPFSALTQEQRRKITASKLEKFAAALDEARPKWMYEYAAAAVVQLPRAEKRIRKFMLHLLFKDETNTACALAALAQQVTMLPAPQRPGALTVIFSNLGSLSVLRTSNSIDELESALMTLVNAANAPPTPLAFARAAIPVLGVLAKFCPGSAFTTSADKRDPISQLLPLLERPYKAFLMRRTWGAFAEEISSALWDQIWRRGRAPARESVPVPASGQGELHKYLIAEAAWAEADAAIGRALQDIGILTRSFDKLEEVTVGDAAMRAKAARGASNLILQWVRQAARYRDIEAQCAIGHRAEFDPVFHDSDEAVPGEPVRIIKPPIVRSTGSPQVVLLRGDVEPE